MGSRLMSCLKEKFDIRDLAAAFAILMSLAGCSASPSDNFMTTADAIEASRSNPPYLRMILRQMPKGGELHSHLAGAVWAESYINWATQDGLCVDQKNWAIVSPPCSEPDRPSMATVNADTERREQLIASLSAGHYLEEDKNQHDRFFASFSRFNSAGNNHGGDMLAEVLDLAAGDRVTHLELMSTFNGGWAKGLTPHRWSENFDAEFAQISASGLAAAVASGRAEVDAVETAARQRMNCEGQAPAVGCGISHLWIQQVNRALPPDKIFAAMTLAFELVKNDPRIVGITLVGPEDGAIAVSDYDLHMRMLAWLHQRYPAVSLTLHAGELILGPVSPRDLRSHIRQAIEVAGSRRIGHGVDVNYEDDPIGLLNEMAARRVLVEINLTSNDLILGVRGDTHPFDLYATFGVPMALSTDDAGVGRIDLTHEFQRAVEEHGIHWDGLKRLVRNSIEYSFLPGESLWGDTVAFIPVETCQQVASEQCATWASTSRKAAAQRGLELALQEFEARQWPVPSRHGGGEK